MTILSIELPLPPSINATYRGAYRGGRLLLTDAAQAWQTEAGYILNGWDVQPIKGKCAVSMSVFMPYKEKGDMHNFNPKLCLDALQGHAYTNDRFVTELHVIRQFDKSNPHLKIVIASLDRRDDLVEDVIGCARCDHNHWKLTFKKLERPIVDLDGTVWGWWAACPITLDPILLRGESSEAYADDTGLRYYAKGKT